MVKAMIKREQGRVQREDISFGRDALERALWQLSLVLRDIAATDDQAEKPKHIEKKEPAQVLMKAAITTNKNREERTRFVK